MTQDMAESVQKAAVAETVVRIFHALDDRDWGTIAALTTDPVDIDYPSKLGGAEKISTEDFVSGLRAFLPGFDSTQHLLAPTVVELETETQATVRFHARVTHVLTEVADVPIWVIGCHYTFGFEHQDDIWKLCSSRVEVLYEEGNRDLETVARRRAQPLQT
ncbi:hypothetical protein F4561_006467 [Lipingzhangella halophila]|uniref:SnoaL-like domain-containing protein n=1 Tax=Lipingzhangella halophila TaxID=1783352 RepID=A0A7W7RQ39_9ACTN|nr:nuclear transport factor 2 family protein [Lipingzhangella halophila]MBB4935573.1 hypothetical protein [Lipingzhangella halophila]